MKTSKQLDYKSQWLGAQRRKGAEEKGQRGGVRGFFGRSRREKNKCPTEPEESPERGNEKILQVFRKVQGQRKKNDGGLTS